MADLTFKAQTIAPAGRNKYGNYMSSTNVTKSVVTTTYAGNGTTTTIGDTGSTEDNENISFYCMLSQTNIVFDASDVADGASASTQVIAYRGYDKAPTYIMDMEAVELVTSGTGNEVHIAKLTPPENYGIVGIESGLTVEVVSGTNGTSATSIMVYADSTLLANKGVLSIPVVVYKRSDAIPEPENLYDWYDSMYSVTSAGTIPTNECEQVWLELGWSINRASTSNYQMDLSNEKAGVNVSAITQTGDILYPNSIATLECTASTHMGTELVTGLSYTLATHPQYHAKGVDIVNAENRGVLVFTSAGTNSFNFDGPTLPINITASNGSGFSITKTMTIEKNYPGSEGQAAVTKWIVTSVNEAKYNPNTGAKAPEYVTAYVMKQVGGDEPFVDTGETIYYWYASTPPSTSSQATPLPSTGATVIPEESYIVFALMNSQGVFYEKETVLILWDGSNGTPGASGAPGTNGTDGQSAWYLTMSNDNASINADAAGNIYPTSVNPSSSKLKMYYGSNRMYDATYSMSANTGYTGVTLSTSNDGVGTISFSQGTGSQHSGRFNFEGDILELTVSGTSSGAVRDVKVMTIIKSRAGAAGEDGSTPYISGGTWWIGNTDTGIQAEGQDGEDGNTPYIGPNGNWWIGNTDTGIRAEGRDAITYWLEPSFGEVIFNPNTNTPNPSAITCTKHRQEGPSAPTTAFDGTIKYQWQYRGQSGFYPSNPLNFTTASTGMQISAQDCKDYRRLRLTLWVGSSQVDMEDIDILMDGIDASASEGRRGPAIRGPYDYSQYSGATRCWCAGQSSSTCSDCDKWIDILLKDGVYYECTTTYYGKIYPWNTYKSYWTQSDEQYDFIAAGLILAENAKIEFLSNNELYLMDENGDITGGAKGGSGITFWAGGDLENLPENKMPFRIYNDGTIYAQRGVFAGYIQYPYTFVSDLTRKSAPYKLWDRYYSGSTYYPIVCDSFNGEAYCADQRAYLVSDSTNMGRYSNDPADLVLPVPTSAWNGFTYDIIVEPTLTKSEGPNRLNIYVSGQGSTSAVNYNIHCYAYSELRTTPMFTLNGGRYQITCMPRHGSIEVYYAWAITNATGAIDAINPRARVNGNTVVTGTIIEAVSTLVATSYDANPLYKLTTYTGSTKPPVSNSSRTMFIQK